MASADVPLIRRADFIQALTGAVEIARGGSTHLGLLLIDISNLARINHSHGYDVGDRLLATAHRELLGISRMPDTVFRVSSHSFAFLLPELGNPAYIALALNKVTGLLKGELHIDSGMVGADLHVGVAVNHNGGRDAMAMLALAEASLSHVKLGGDHQLEALLLHERDELADSRLEQQFAEALRDNDFELYYQPKVNLHTGRVESAEALLRWSTPNGEPVRPEMVVSMAESMGRSFELTKWVVHQALRQLQRWQDDPGIGLAINVQAGLVGNPDLGSLFNDAPAIWGVDPGKITVEITEDAIIKDKQAGWDNLQRIRVQGINLSIDDFGTGYSSLSYFKHIPAAELKIDKSFIRTLRLDVQNLELVKIMIHIAKQFDLSVVAEGVEDSDSLDLLRDLGCDYAQGFYFTPPLPARDFEHWIDAWPGFNVSPAS